MNAKSKAVLIAGMLLLCGVAASHIASKPTTTEISDALSSTVIEHLVLKDVPIPVAVSVIDAEFRRKHPELRDVELVTKFHEYSPELGPDINLITTDLHNIPADEAFRSIAELTYYRFVVHGGVIYFGDPSRPVTFSERLRAKGREVYWKLYYALRGSP